MEAGGEDDPPLAAPIPAKLPTGQEAGPLKGCCAALCPCAEIFWGGTKPIVTHHGGVEFEQPQHLQSHIGSLPKLGWITKAPFRASSKTANVR